MTPRWPRMRPRVHLDISWWSTSLKQSWKWAEGAVDLAKDHFELWYGSADSDSATWILIARVGPSARRVFPVQFVADREAAAAEQMIEEAARELTYYLIELGEQEPWAYAQYHCSTTSNVYSHIHWSFCRRGQPPNAG